MPWAKDILRGCRDNAAYEVGRYVILLIWPFALAGIYTGLSWLGTMRWNWRINAGLLLIALIILCVTAWRIIWHPRALVSKASPNPPPIIPLPEIATKAIDQPSSKKPAEEWPVYIEPRYRRVKDCIREASRLLRDDGKNGAQEIWSFNAMCRSGADQLHDSSEVTEVCAALVSHGYKHPFEGIEPYVSPDEYLEFVTAATHRSLCLEMSGDYLLLAEQWPSEHGRSQPTIPIPSSLLVMGQVLRNQGIGTLAPRSVNIAYNKLRELIREGEQMLASFEYSRSGLPTDDAIRNWIQRLVSVAETSATIRELNQLKDDFHNRHIDVAEMIPYELGKPTETYDRVEAVFAKVKLARSIASRLENEDKG